MTIVSGASSTVPLDYLPGTFFGPANLVALLRHRVAHQGDQVAFTWLVDGEHQQVDMTYRELDRHARAIAAWLESHDLVGQRALLCYPPGLEFIAAFFGCLYAKVVAVPVYPPRRNQLASRLQSIVEDAGATVALTTAAVLERVRPLTVDTPVLRDLTWLATCDVPAELAEEWVDPGVHGDTLAFLQYTSGSTGRPKGVMLNHVNLMHNCALIAYGFEHTRSGSGVFWLPSYHDMGLIGGILQPLYVSRPNVMMAPMAFLQKPYRWLSAISRFRGTTSGGPNFAYDLCIRKITPRQRETLDLSCWRVAFNGAEPVRAETLDRFCEVFGPCGFRREAFYPCYGLAEATLIVTGGYTRQAPKVRAFRGGELGEGRVAPVEPSDPDARRLVGCGGVLPDQRVEIVDPETLSRAAPGRIGEIWAAGPSIAQGYWQRPEATAETFEAYLSDSGEGPFMRTGDLGFFHDGELFVTGRLKDLIIIRGVNHYPQDIELTVERSHPGLRAGCAAAVAVEQNGAEELVVFSEVERTARRELGPLFAAIRRDVARQHDLVPAAIVLLKQGTIPKTSSGKIQRHACRDGYLDGSLAHVGHWRIGDPDEGVEDEPGNGAEAAAVENGFDDQEPAAAATPEALDEVESGNGRAEGLLPTAASAAEAPAGPCTCAADAEPAQGNGRAARDRSPARIAEIILEEIRKVAKDRARGLTLDTVIADTGLDSLERMEILASIEERFDCRFPEEIYVELETCRDLVAAVRQYTGAVPGRARKALPPGAEIPAEYYDVARFPECIQLKQHIAFLESSGIRNPFFHVHEGLLTNRTVIEGREVINFASFNYLGLSGDPRVQAAAKEAIDRYGTSVSASRLVSGEKDLHRELERELAAFLGTDESMTFPAGHSTNESVIGHLFGPGDLILHDALAHNSIVQGAILSGARRRPFTHNEPGAADELLRQFRREYRRVLIVIEGVYSMDGDFPDLPEFVEVKRRHKAVLMVDEAHSLGTLGATGRGVGEHFGVPAADVDIWMGTLSKSLGSGGGYIAAAADLVRYLRYTTPAFVFATGISPPNTAAALAALRVLVAEPQRVGRLRDRAALFLSLVKEHGLNTGTSGGTPVIPVILGNSLQCLMASNAMFERGINARPILHPAVEESAARLRFFITSEHTEEELRLAAEVLVEELQKLQAPCDARQDAGAAG